MYKVIDVSRYQGTIDWNKVKADGVQGAILKTVSTNHTEFGGLYIDPTFERNYAECKRLGIPVGVYYYTYAQDKAYADKELALFRKAVDGKTFELPLVVDVEDNKLKPLTAAALTDLVEYALKTIEGWGAYAMVYTYTYYKNTELDMDRLSAYDLWIADYRGNRPDHAHGIWQYTSTGKVAGVDGNCDMNHSYRDYPGIIARKGLNNFVRQSTAEENIKPLSVFPVVMECVASAGDQKTLGDALDGLGIGYTVDGDTLTTGMAVSAGDQVKLIDAAAAIGIVWIIAAEEVDASEDLRSQLEDARTTIDTLTKERDSWKNAAEIATDAQAVYLRKIEAVRAALEG